MPKPAGESEKERRTQQASERTRKERTTKRKTDKKTERQVERQKQENRLIDFAQANFAHVIIVHTHLLGYVTMKLKLVCNVLCLSIFFFGIRAIGICNEFLWNCASVMPAMDYIWWNDCALDSGLTSLQAHYRQPSCKSHRQKYV